MFQMSISNSDQSCFSSMSILATLTESIDFCDVNYSCHTNYKSLYGREQHSHCRQSYLLTRLDSERRENSNCDFVVIVENEKFHVHKMVLRAYSKYFETMFSGDFIEKIFNYVELKQVTKNEFSWLLDHIYGQFMNLRGRKVEEILKTMELADMLCVDTFKEECIREIRFWKRFDQFYIPYEVALKLELDDITSEILIHLLKHAFLPIYRHFLSSFVRLNYISLPLLEDFLKTLPSPGDKEDYIIQQSDLTTTEVLMTGTSLVLKFVSWTTMTEDKSVTLLEKTMIRDLTRREIGLCLTEAKDFSVAVKDWPLSISNEQFQINLKNAFTAVKVVCKKMKEDIFSLNLSLYVTTVNGLTISSCVYDKDSMYRHNLFVTAPVKHIFQNSGRLYLASAKHIFQYKFSNEEATVQSIPETNISKVDFQSIFVLNNETFYLIGKHLETEKVILGMLNLSNDVLKIRDLDLDVNGKLYLTAENHFVYFASNNGVYKYDISTSTLITIIVLPEKIFLSLPTIYQPLIKKRDELYVFSSNNYCLVISLLIDKGQEIIYKKCVSKYTDATPICARVTEDRVVVVLYGPSFDNEVQICVLEQNSNEFRSFGFLPFLHANDVLRSRSQLLCVDIQ